MLNFSRSAGVPPRGSSSETHRKSGLSLLVSTLAVFIPLFVSIWLRLKGNTSNHFAVLGLPAYASRQEIHRKFRLLAKTCHPDATNDTAQLSSFISLQKAYEILIDDNHREFYKRFGDVNIDEPDNNELFDIVCINALIRIIMLLFVQISIHGLSRVDTFMLFGPLLSFSWELSMRYNPGSENYLRWIPWLGSLPQFLQIEVMNIVFPILMTFQFFWSSAAFNIKDIKLLDIILAHSLEAAATLDMRIESLEDNTHLRSDNDVQMNVYNIVNAIWRDSIAKVGGNFEKSWYEELYNMDDCRDRGWLQAHIEKITRYKQSVSKQKRNSSGGGSQWLISLLIFLAFYFYPYFLMLFSKD